MGEAKPSEFQSKQKHISYCLMTMMMMMMIIIIIHFKRISLGYI